MAITNVLMYEGDNKTFVWKHPEETFNYGSTLIVRESQEAAFMLNGEVVQVYGPGKHILETETIPVAKGLSLITAGGKVPSRAELYFVNKTEQMAIRWGTDSKIQYMDPEYNFPLEIGACGEMSLTAANATKLLIKVVGTEKNLTQQQLVTYFRAFLMNRIKTTLAHLIVENKISIFNIDMYLTQLSDAIKELLKDDFYDYGVELKSFLIMTIVKPDDDRNYQKFKELYFRQHTDVVEAELQQKLAIIEEQTRAQQTVIEAEALSKKRQLEGYTYQQERGFDVATEVARNEAIGQMSNVGIGLGVMTGMSGTIAGTVGSATSNAIQSAINQSSQMPAQKQCAACGYLNPADNAFCENCGGALTDNRFCQACGFEFKNDAKFCPKCGARR